MQGTYLDLPGHIVETDDGRRADTIPVSELYRRPATVLHLDRPLVPGPVSADHLQTALGDRRCHDMLIIHALGDQNTFQVTERSIYLDDSAVDWIINRQCRWLVSDIYESTALHGVFLKLFGAGVATVCEPQNLHLLPPMKSSDHPVHALPNITQPANTANLTERRDHIQPVLYLGHLLEPTRHCERAA